MDSILLQLTKLLIFVAFFASSIYLFDVGFFVFLVFFVEDVEAFECSNAVKELPIFVDEAVSEGGEEANN